jgi:RHS repeat-associated protein
VDALGSTVALSDGTGALPTSYTYAPFGAASLSGSASGNTLDYTGRENDGTGLHYYRARYYHPNLQRFIDEDPIGLAAGINVYAYALNNPLRFIDPLGLDATIKRYRCCAGFEHIGIGVGKGEQPTSGFYPVTRHMPLDRGVVLPDTERNTREEYVEQIVLKTTEEQDRRIKAYIDARRLKPGIYNLASRNCGNFVQDALAAGGIVIVGPVASPVAFFEMLKAMNNANVDFTRDLENLP